MRIPPVLRRLIRLADRNSPKLLTGIAVFGFGTTVILVAKEAPIAKARGEEARERYIYEYVKAHPDADPENLRVPVMTVVKAEAPVYIPAILSGTLTVASIIGANAAGSRKYAALASLYSASELAYKEYREKATEVFGEQKAKEIVDAIAEEKVLRQHPLDTGNIFGHGEPGDIRFMEGESGRRFFCTMDKLRRAENDFNREIISQMEANLNEWYYLIGLPPIPLGEDKGWNVDHMMDIVTSAIVDVDDRPTIVISYREPPRKYNF